MRPVIGITSYVEPARWGSWDATATLVPHAYVEQVHAAGGRAIVIPPAPPGESKLLDILDGLLFAGGADIDPAAYGAQPDPRTTNLRPDRDAAELPLLRAALRRDVPLLGICRGMQLLAVAGGGSLLQHLPDVVGHDRHGPGPGRYGAHTVRLVPGSRIAAILGQEAVVASHHHQGVADPGTFTKSGFADDGVLEVLEAPDARFAIGVLWHPEVGEDPRLFEALVTAAQDTANSRSASEQP